MKFSKEIIKKAQRLYKSGKSAYFIGKELSMSTKNVLWHCNEKSRKKIKKQTYLWMKANPERWKAIMAKANKKYKAKHAK